MSTAQSTRVGRPRHVAVIGSGLAGLTTAYLLRREGCEVWLIEKVRPNRAFAVKRQTIR